MNPLQLALTGAVHLYRATLKPLLPPACRFEPSCSAYALEAVRLHGALRGGWLALARLLRCRPGGGGGPDPVPPLGPAARPLARAEARAAEDRRRPQAPPDQMPS